MDEGHDNSRDVANEKKTSIEPADNAGSAEAKETKKHPWEIFPEDDSTEKGKGSGASRGKKETPEQREKKKARRERSRARLNSIKEWILKNKILAVGIVLVVIAGIVGGVMIIINNAPESEEEKVAEVENELQEIEQLKIPDEFTVEEVATPDYAYTIIRVKLSEAIEDIEYNSDGTWDMAKVEDTIDAYIRDNVKNEADKPAFELTKIVFLANNMTEHAGELLEDLDNRNLPLGRNTRYIYIMAKLVYYVAEGNEDEVTSWRNTLNSEYLNDESFYLDEETYEAVSSEEE